MAKSTESSEKEEFSLDKVSVVVTQLYNVSQWFNYLRDRRVHDFLRWSECPEKIQREDFDFNDKIAETLGNNQKKIDEFIGLVQAVERSNQDRIISFLQENTTLTDYLYDNEEAISTKKTLLQSVGIVKKLSAMPLIAADPVNLHNAMTEGGFLHGRDEHTRSMRFDIARFSYGLKEILGTDEKKVEYLDALEKFRGKDVFILTLFFTQNKQALAYVSDNLHMLEEPDKTWEKYNQVLPYVSSGLPVAVKYVPPRVVEDKPAMLKVVEKCEKPHTSPPKAKKLNADFVVLKLKGIIESYIECGGRVNLLLELLNPSEALQTLPGFNVAHQGAIEEISKVLGSLDLEGKEKYRDIAMRSLNLDFSPLVDFIRGNEAISEVFEKKFAYLEAITIAGQEGLLDVKQSKAVLLLEMKDRGEPKTEVNEVDLGGRVEIMGSERGVRSCYK